MSRRNLHQGFDVLVVDEAAQPIEAELLIATTLRPKQMILAGDPRQLSATIESGEARPSWIRCFTYGAPFRSSSGKQGSWVSHA